MGGAPGGAGQLGRVCGVGAELRGGKALCVEQGGRGWTGQVPSPAGFPRLPSWGDCSLPRLRAVLPQKGETWPMPNCSQATCEGNGIISVHRRHCPHAQPPTCANGFPPAKVADHDGCCPGYQCQCESGARRGSGAEGVPPRGRDALG